MPGKFTEILDTTVTPSYSERNVSLDDILRETRERSDSQSSSSGSGHSSPTNASNGDLSASSTTPTSPKQTKLRRFTLGKKG